MQSTNKRTNEQTIKCARYRCVIHFLGERIKCDLLCYCLHRFTCCTRIDSNSPFNILRWSVGLLFLSIVLFEFSEQILFFFSVSFCFVSITKHYPVWKCIFMPIPKWRLYMFIINTSNEIAKFIHWIYQLNWGFKSVEATKCLSINGVFGLNNFFSC